MLKSLFSGVSGLQSHQVAMDVESNNIANVNTIGFKYSRANFSDLLAQTKAIATAPQGELGGKNPVQVGLGSTVSSMTRIFSQGSVENSDKNTDVAIQGDGFFIISPDGGNTYKYTRSGDFKFDAGGNFVDNNGFIVQGWLRDRTTGFVDATAPITNINIPPGLTTPASPTQNVVIKANLNSGPLVKTFSPAYSVESGAPYSVANVGYGDAKDANGNPIDSGDLGVMFNDSGEAFSLQTGQGIWASFQNSTTTGSGNVVAGAVELDITFTLDDGTTKQITTTGGLAGNTVADNAARFLSAINAQTSTTGIVATYDATNNEIDLTNTNSNGAASHNIRISAVGNVNSGLAVLDSVTTAYRYQYDPTGATTVAGADKKFKTIADLRYAMEIEAKSVDADGSADVLTTDNNISIIINAQGKFEITNPGGATDDYDISLAITGMTADSVVGGGITENAKFTRNMEALSSTLPSGTTGKAFSQSFNAATHSASIDIYDSLGSKHTLRTEYRKVAVDSSTGSTWNMKISVPEPATIDTVAPTNEKTGSIRFNNDGSLATFNPPNVSFTANNGSASNQQVAINLGTANGFDGMTSFDSVSSTSGISQDGYTGGDLVGIRIDQSGTLIGSFSNGRSFGLAQIGMAKFTNNEGLSTEGGNVYTQTANSGDPIIGTAATAGRGFMQSSALEASNVDLSRSLTQLIIIQRGYQANGKTITTSDQLLQTLIGLKQ
ncbi:MAG: flagellar hook protein FlgE [Sulfurimonas sp. RIFOXYD12_FULL_33_39]|uniref:flagellar hook protein FlgE n=1 Tax=unclassified Sulfurimonas TaxID=2623549 RepID=UPI0008C8B444|nr:MULTISPECIES: flagellar hook protein FlgE [unclassified Sulfurimonas]OHE04624.1 MAG: flagellar hook protein FlgE [Sulfurimonas sp. RIFCSPLOWO2_12_FULL_34_6]OHE10867.1 MAG: flagellar hook protein FlgE [Sulfurimonas sp. RIFOXYD12_FULL_33_39]OHE13363.1 MAG: flagellar hook protein FlgE [Sulfurimonas sp. RIFOXYD2_FULL_34_21]DAB27794.1 MAG TPA: flagellar hook protein FlgE [Sulfurimonas sp. UBA10385]